MATKVISAAIAAGALLFSTGIAAAADARPQTNTTTAASADAPVTGVRANRSLKKKSRELSTLAILGIVAGVGGTIGGIIAVTDGPSSP